MCRTNYSESHLFRLLRDQKTPLDWTLTKHPDLQFALRLSAVWEPRHQFLPTLVKTVAPAPVYIHYIRQLR